MRPTFSRARREVAAPFNFGSIETYDDSQIQKGNDTLARLIPGQTVRVQAIAKTELDKIKLDEAVARYVLGVRERNVRVVYLRPWPHQNGDLSIEATNVEIVKRDRRPAQRPTGFDSAARRRFRSTAATIASGRHRRAGRALDLRALARCCSGGTAAAGRSPRTPRPFSCTPPECVRHHDLLVRSVLALAGALLFATAAFLALAPAFAEQPSRKFGAQMLRSIGWTLAGTGVALARRAGRRRPHEFAADDGRDRALSRREARPGAAAADRLAALHFQRRFDSGIEASARRVRRAHPGVSVARRASSLIAAGALLVMRSGNQSDVAPSAVRTGVAARARPPLLSVRPRFKEFAIGFPVMMLLPALSAAHRRAVGLAVRARHRRRHRRHHRHVLAPAHAARRFRCCGSSTAWSSASPSVRCIVLIVAAVPPRIATAS